jgi:hypothetical protein
MILWFYYCSIESNDCTNEFVYLRIHGPLLVTYIVRFTGSIYI